jgi:hypothetical protein
MPTLLDHCTDYLVAEGLVRKPSVPAPGGNPNLPVLWRHPRNGVPAPGEGSGIEIGPTIVVGAFHAAGFATEPYESFRRIDGIDFRIRVTAPPIATAFEESLRALLIDKRAWTMGSITVIESRQFRPFQPIGSSNQSYDFSTEYQFEIYSADFS